MALLVFIGTFPGQLLGQEPPGPTVLVAMEAAKALEPGPRITRPGLRLQAVLSSGVSPYVTLGLHPAAAVACFHACRQPSPVREAIVGLNYRPDLGDAPLGLFIGAGYGILHDRDRPSVDGTLDVHGAIELRADVVGVRAELRRLVDPDRDTFNGVAVALGLIAEVPDLDAEPLRDSGDATGRRGSWPPSWPSSLH